MEKDILLKQNAGEFIKIHRAEMPVGMANSFIKTMEDYTLEDLCGLSKDALLQFYGMGIYRANAIESLLKKYGMRLKQNEIISVSIPESKKIDWEQRKYEIAKECLPHWLKWISEHYDELFTDDDGIDIDVEASKFAAYTADKFIEIYSKTIEQ